MNFYYCASKLSTAIEPITFNYLYQDLDEEVPEVTQSIRQILTALNFTDPFEDDPTSCYPYVTGFGNPGSANSN